MKIYHYTKGVALNSIFNDGFIGTEMCRGLNNTPHVTNNAWLTEKTSFPKTALPLIATMPETQLMLHVGKANVYVDLNKIGSFTGGIYRFVFDSTDTRFKKWWHSEERKALSNNFLWQLMEKVANKVGDDVRSFWVCEENIALENFTLQAFENGVWVDKLVNCSLSNIDKDTNEKIEQIKTKSQNKCAELGINLEMFRKAA